MTARDKAFLVFLFVVILCILAPLIWIAFSKIRLGIGPRLPPPDRRCDRLAAEHWRAGSAVSGWRP